MFYCTGRYRLHKQGEAETYLVDYETVTLFNLRLAHIRDMPSSSWGVPENNHQGRQDCKPASQQRKTNKELDSWHSKLYWTAKIREPSMVAYMIWSINCLINYLSHQNWFPSVSADWQCHANPSCQNSQGMAVQTPFLKKPKFSTFVYTHKVLREVCLIDQFT